MHWQKSPISFGQKLANKSFVPAKAFSFEKTASYSLTPFVLAKTVENGRRKVCVLENVHFESILEIFRFRQR